MDDSDEKSCRICRCGEEAGQLFHPCKCSGSIKFIHEHCLTEWLGHSKKPFCELCHHNFTFKPIYAEDAPQHLPSTEVLSGVRQKVVSGVNQCVRTLFVCFVWLVWIPLLTNWATRMYLLPNLGEFWPRFMLRLDATEIITDSLYGSILCAAIVLFFLALVALRDFIKFHKVGHELLQKCYQDRQHDEEDEPIAPAVADHVEPTDNVRENENVGVEDAAQLDQGHNNDELANEGDNQHADPRVERRFADDGNPNGEEILPELPQVLAAPAQAQNGGNDIFGMLDGNPEGIPLEELFGFKGDIGSLCWNVFSVLVFNNIFLVGCVWIPVMTGAFVVYLVGGDYVEIWSPSEAELIIAHLLAGYFTLIVCSLLVHWAVDVAQKIWCYEMGIYVEHLMVAILHCYTLWKINACLTVQWAVFPLVTGILLNLATMQITGISVDETMEFVQYAPFAIFVIHWVFGTMYMLYVNVIFSIVRPLLHPSIAELCITVIWFLRNVDQMNEHPLKAIIHRPFAVHVGKYLLSGIGFMLSMFLFVFLPISLCCMVFKDTFPYELKPQFPDIPVDLLLFHVFVPFTIENFHPKAAFSDIIQSWLKQATTLLDVREECLSEESYREWFNEAPNVDQPRKSYFSFRIVLMGIWLWFGVVLATCFLLVVPVFIGRTILDYYGLSIHQDVYNFGLGFYVMWGLSASSNYITGRSVQHWRDLVIQLIKWVVLAVKILYLSIFWIIVMPCLIGVLIELLILPLRVQPGQTALLSLPADWGIGLLSLKIWFRTVLVWENQWKRKFDRIFANGFENIEVLWITTHLFVPMLSNTLPFLTIPYLFSRGVVPLFGFTLEMDSLVFQWAFRWWLNIHNKIRDDKYLIGTQLSNVGTSDNEEGEVGETAPDQSYPNQPDASSADPSVSSSTSAKSRKQRSRRQRIQGELQGPEESDHVLKSLFSV